MSGISCARMTRKNIQLSANPLMIIKRLRNVEVFIWPLVSIAIFFRLDYANSAVTAQIIKATTETTCKTIWLLLAHTQGFAIANSPDFRLLNTLTRKNTLPTAMTIAPTVAS